VKFIFADSIDVVDPNYDFLNDRNGAERTPYWDDRYPHEMLEIVPYDGILVSLGIVGDHKFQGKYSTTQRMRFLRVGARKFLRLDTEDLKSKLLFGDCGAFSFAKLDEPPYSAEEMVDFYGDGQFTHGCSVDHVIFDFDREGTKLQGGSEEARRRFDITLRNAAQFISSSRILGDGFTPIGVVQGWSPGSIAEAAKRLERMGYTYLALGGMVPLNAASIHAVLKDVRRVISSNTRIHILGFAKAEQIDQFLDYGIESFDSTSPLIRAFKDSQSNYYVLSEAGGLDYYMAIRIPQATENLKLVRAAKIGKLKQEDLLAMEMKALQFVRSYDKGTAALEPTLDAVIDYNRVMIESVDGANAVTERQLSVLRERSARTLKDMPWKQCRCAICKDISIEVMIFRSSNRNKRRGFHNLAVYYEHLQRTFSGQSYGRETEIHRSKSEAKFAA